MPALFMDSLTDCNRLFLNAVQHSHITVIVTSIGIPIHFSLCYYFAIVRNEQSNYLQIAMAEIITQAIVLITLTIASSK